MSSFLAVYIFVANTYFITISQDVSNQIYSLLISTRTNSSVLNAPKAISFSVSMNNVIMSKFRTLYNL